MAFAYIGLGANLEEPQQQIEQAMIELAHLQDSKLVAQSSLYHSKPVGPQDQPDYVNAAVLIETQLEPIALLDALQQLELDHGRIRKRHWGERTLDLDIILIDNLIIDSERLQIPHPFAQQRSFVLYPLSDINPDLVFPDGKCLEQLLTELDNDLIRIRV